MNDAQMSELIDRAGEIAAALQARNHSFGQSCSFGECLVAASNLMAIHAVRGTSDVRRPCGRAGPGPAVPRETSPGVS
ncbi:MAG: hypothetical protein ABFE13_01455 [Phycisphaerales bacterium]